MPANYSRDDRKERQRVSLQLGGKPSSRNGAKNVATNFGQVKPIEAIVPNPVLCAPLPMRSGSDKIARQLKLDSGDKHVGHELDGMAYDGVTVSPMVRRDAQGKIVLDRVVKPAIVKARPDSPFKRAKRAVVVVRK